MPCNPWSPPPPVSPPPPRGVDRVCSGALPSSYVPRACTGPRARISGGDAELDCHYLSLSPPEPPPPLEGPPLSVAPLSVLPGLRWQSFKDHTSRTHAALHECVSIHTWEEDYTSPPRQP